MSDKSSETKIFTAADLVVVTELAKETRAFHTVGAVLGPRAKELMDLYTDAIVHKQPGYEANLEGWENEFREIAGFSPQEVLDALEVKRNELGLQ